MAKRKNPAVVMLWVIAVVSLPIGALMGIYHFNNRPPNIPIPTHSVPKDNGFDYFLRATKLIAAKKHFGPLSDPNPKHVWTIQEYESFMKSNAAAFALVKEGLKRPCIHPPVREYGDSITFHSGFRELARTLGSAAQYYELTGQYRMAMDARLDCAEFAVSFENGGPLITGLVGSAVEAIGRKNIEKLLPKLSEDELARAALRIEKIQSKRLTFSQIILEEGYATAGGMTRLYRHPSYDANLLDRIKGDSFALDRTITNLRLEFANKTGVVRDMLVYHKALAKEQKGYYTGTSAVPPMRNAIFAHIDTSYLPRSRAIFERRASLMTILQTEVALRRFQLDHGCYPTNLEALTPRYLKTIPIDPFGQGRPLNYDSTDGKKFKLYSLGPDLKDDGGKPCKWHGENTKGDLVSEHLTR